MKNHILKIIEPEALIKLPSILGQFAKVTQILLIADNNTWKVAGEQVNHLLIENGYQVTFCILVRDEVLVPDERALGEILVKMDRDIELLLAVGSGSITDLTRFVANKFNKPFISVPTAPSMDGYSSSVAPLTIHGFKQTLPAVVPTGIVGDVNILAKAPKEMILAGLGDLLGKYTSLADWKLGQFINGEAYSDSIATMVRDTVDQTVGSLQRDLADPTLIRNLTEALIISGEAMQEWGDSRPASGAEHHMAHFWEMQGALQGHKSYLHGTKVGIAEILVLGLYHHIFSMDMIEIRERIANCPDETESAYNSRIQKAYGPLATDVLADLKCFYLDSERRKVRQASIIKNWGVMKSWVQKNVPNPSKIRELMISTGAPVEPGQIEVDEKLLRLTLENAKEVRRRYTIFRLAEDIGWNVVC